MPLLCLAFLGTRNVGQRKNDSIFTRSDFLGSRTWSRFPCGSSRFDSRASPSGVQTDILGVEEDRTGCEEAARDLKSHFGAWQETCRAARDDAARVSFFICAARLFGPIPSFFLSFFSLDPTSPLLALLLISDHPGLRLTNRFRLHAPRVSTFPSLPFFSVLNGRNVLIWSFFFLCLLVFFS